MTFDQSSVTDEFEPSNECFGEAQKNPENDLKRSCSSVFQEESTVKMGRANPQEIEDSQEGLDVACEILQHLLDVVMPPSCVKVNPWMEIMEEVVRENIPLDEPCEEWDGVCWVRVTEQAGSWERRTGQQETLDLGSEGGGINKSWASKGHSFTPSSKRARFTPPAPPNTKDSSDNYTSPRGGSRPSTSGGPQSSTRGGSQPSTNTMTTDTLRRLRACGINISRTPELPTRPQVDPRGPRVLPRGINLPRGVSLTPNLPRGVPLTPSVTVAPTREARKRPADEDIGEVARSKEKTKRNYSPEKSKLSPRKTEQTMSQNMENDAPGTSTETVEATTSSGTLREPAAKKMRLESLCATSMEGTLATLVVLGVLWARRNVLDRARNTFNEDTGLEVGEDDYENFRNYDNSNKKSVEQNNDTILDYSNDVDETVSGCETVIDENAVLEPNGKVEEKKEAVLKPTPTKDNDTSSKILRRRTWPQTRTPVLGSSCRTRAAYLNRLPRVAYLHRQTRRRS